MTLLGQWPHQSARAGRGFLGLFIFVAITGLPPPILAFVRCRDNWNIVLESVNSGLYVTVCVMKMICIMWNSQKVCYISVNYNLQYCNNNKTSCHRLIFVRCMQTLILLNRICTNWPVWSQDREVNILHKYAEKGKKMTIVYTGQSSIPKGG